MFIRGFARVVVAVGACLALGFGGEALARATGFTPRSRNSAPPLSSATASEAAGAWRSGGPYGGDVQALALSPAFRTDGLALAGGWRTGGYGVTGGYGIVRTTDGGASWHDLQNENHRWPIYDLALSAAFASDQTAFAGTEVGLLRSTDRGDTWTTLYGGLPGCEHGSRCAIGRVRLSPAFNLDGTVLAAQSVLTDASAYLYRSTDRGVSWTRILTGTVTAPAFSRDFATNHIVFAAQFDDLGATRLLRSTDAGLTWTEAKRLTGVQVNDILETYDGALLLATGDGVLRLVADGDTYIVQETNPNTGAAVNRLAMAGDHQYAAGENGLFISLSDGRRWDRYADTPTVPFRAVAPCPLWGECHSLLAGTHTGLLFTPDDNLVATRWLPGPHPVSAGSVAASPAYEADDMLFAGTDHGIFRSTDRGGAWQLMVAGAPAGDDTAFPAVRLSPAFAADGTVFATFENVRLAQTALYKSTDRGVSWTIYPAVGGGRALAVSPAYAADHTVFFGRGDRLFKSTDGGATWASTPMAAAEEGFITFALEASPAYAADRTLFATGYGQVRRSTDGGATWASQHSYAPSYGLAISPNYAADRTVWHTYRAIEGVGDGTPESGVLRTTDGGAIWSFATFGLPGTYEPFPIPLAASPRFAADKTLFTMLTGQPLSGQTHDLYRAQDGGNGWVNLGPAPGNPNPQALTATALSAGWLTAHVATDRGVWHYDTGCRELVTAGGFEGGADLDNFWRRVQTPILAAYSGARFHSGGQSLRTGIDGAADKYGYSSAQQELTIPADAASAELTFWWYPISAEGPLAAAEAAALENTRAGDASRLLSAGLTDDRQYALLLDTNGGILKTLMFTRSNTKAWQQASFDLTAYRGRTVRIHFETFNDGDGRSTAMYVDDVSLRACWPAAPTPSPTATLTRTPSVTPTRGPVRPQSFLPLMVKNYPSRVTPTATRTPTPSATPSRTPTGSRTATRTPTPDPLTDRWLRNLVIEPGDAGRLLGITNGGRLVSSPDRGETWSYLALPAALGDALEGDAALGMDYNHPATLYLGAGTQGLWRSTDGGVSWEKRHPIQIGPVAVGLDDPQVLWAGVRDPATMPLARSTDGGLTWSSTEPRTERWPISPILIDPQAHNLVYTVTMNRRSTAALERTFDTYWESITAPVNPASYPPGGYPSRGLALDSTTRGLYVGNPDGTLYVSYNAFALDKGEITWQPVHNFGFQPSPLAVGAGPGGAALYVTINAEPWDTGLPGRTLRSDDGGRTWMPLTIPPPAGLPPTATPTRTATPTPTAIIPTVTPGACFAGFTNGGFETDDGWTLRTNPVLAAYVTSPTHGEARSMRTGIAAGGSNVLSYSPIEQAVTFPAGLAAARLSFWRYNVNGDVSAAAPAGNVPVPAVLPRTEAELAQRIDANDFFYVIAIRPDGTIDWLLTESLNQPAWRQMSVDVSRYRGQTIRFQFGTYNNGSNGISRTFVDDVSLELCPPAGALVLPTGWATRVIGRPEMRTLYAEAGGLLYRSDDAGATWRATGTLPAAHVLLSAAPNTLYAGNGASCYSGAEPPPAWRSTDSGATWQVLPAALGLKPLAAHPSDPDRLYLGVCGGPFISTNGGATVTQQTDPLFTLLDSWTIAPAGGEWQEVWVGGVSEGGGGAVLVSRDGGATWARSTPLEANMGWFGDLKLDRYLLGWVYAAMYYGFYTTDDDGATWRKKSEGLAEVIETSPGAGPYGLLSLAQQPLNPEHRLYLGTARGLYTRSLAEDAWWKLSGQPFDAQAVNELLLLDAAADDLYVTTPAGVFIYHPGSAAPTPTATVTPTATPASTRTPTRTPTTTLTPTRTPTGAAIPTAEPGSWPTPHILATLKLPAGSHPHGIALNAAGDSAYVAFHGVDHSGRFLGVVRTSPLQLQQTIELATTPAGPNQVAWVPRDGLTPLVAVTERQIGELTLLAPGIQRRLSVGDMPDGVAVAGRYLYTADFSSNSVSIFDRNTLDRVQTISVDREPALFAADETTGDLFLSVHGANKVFRLHDAAVTQEFTGIPAPYGLAFDPASRRLYVANRGDNHTVTVLDLAAGASAGTIGLGKEPFVLAVNPDTGHLFVACGDTVEVYRTLDWAHVTTLPVAAGAEEGIAINSADDRVYVTSSEGDALTVIQDATTPLVLFYSDRDGGSDLYRMLPDGREQMRLTFTPAGSELGATGSPDGRWIAYSGLEGDGPSKIWVMSRDGHNPRSLVSDGSDNVHPTWSPDGTRLAFARLTADGYDIYTVRVADGLLTRLTVNDAADLDPSWSWATGRIAFQSNRSGVNGELFSMAADGSDVRPLTANSNGDAWPSWAPAGDRLVFWGSRAEQTIYRINADGSGILPLASQMLRPGAPAWGPAAAAGWIVFTGYRPGSGYSEVLRVAPDGAELALLTFNEVNFDAATGWLPGTP